MTSTGTGVGGNVGGPSIPLQRDLEATAWTEINKAALGIVHDSIEKAFTELNPRYNPGYIGGFGYKTTSENPLLDHPLEIQRRSELSKNNTGDNWQQTYEDLVNQLPADLLLRFTNEGNKPFDERNPTFVALDNVFQMTAKILTQTNNAAKEPSDISLEAARTTLNLLLPFAALKGAISNGLEVTQSATNFLTDQGANYRYFDGFNSVLSQLQSPLKLMQSVNLSLSTTKGGQLSPQAIQAASKAAEQLETIRTKLESMSLGPDLQVVLANIKTLEIAATALSLPITSSSPLFIALASASIGLYSNDSSLGAIGPGFGAVTKNLMNGFQLGLMANNNKASSDMLSNLTTLSFVLFTSLGSLAIQSGLGLYPLKSSQDIDNAHFFAFETMLQLATSSGFIEKFYQEAIAIAGGDPQAQQLGSSILSQVATYLVILSASMTAKRDPTNLIENEAPHLRQGVASAEQIQEEELNQEVILQELKSDRITAVALATKLAALALDSKDYEGFLDASSSLFESLNTSLLSIEKDIAQINKSAEITIGTTSMGDPNQQLTGMVNII